MGFIKEASQMLQEEALGRVVGPTVHLMNHDAGTGAWTGTVLLACKTIDPTVIATLAYSAGSDAPTDVQAEVLTTHRTWTVYRFPVRTHLRSEAATIRYSISVTGFTEVSSGAIPLQAAGAPWRVIAYSCNDQRQEPRVGTACWERVETMHTARPVHVMLGTGDQLYNDNVWHGEEISKWVAQPDKAAMRATPLSAAQSEEVADFYFFAYLRWIKFHPLRERLCSIPQMNTWDDHDIFDGWGSYPDKLQTCLAFQDMFASARRWYEVFQMHTTPERAAADGYFGGAADKGLSWISQLGPGLAVAALDTRSGRTRKQIVDPATVEGLVSKIAALPDSVKHVVMVSAVPIAYPEVASLERFMSALERKTALLSKTGIYNKLMNEFGEPELLDDIMDHWSSSAHRGEKTRLLTSLRACAAEHQLRISLLSGDVHQCAFCYTCSSPDGASLGTDAGFMPQLISSAMGYLPPANAIVKVLDRCSGRSTRLVTAAAGDAAALYEATGWLFADKAARPSISRRFANRNNFIEFQVATAAEGPLAGVPMLDCKLHVRRGIPKTEQPDFCEFLVTVPPLLGPGDGAAVALVQDDLRRYMPQARKNPFCCGA